MANSIIQTEISKLPTALQEPVNQLAQALIAVGVDQANNLFQALLAGNWQPAYAFVESNLSNAALIAAQDLINTQQNAAITAEQAKQATIKAILSSLFSILLTIGLAAL
jgi:HPt (histidine-containing phosphotransfer) domain-containing protein